MTNLFSNEFQTGVEALHQTFVAAAPFPHIVIDKFLESELCARLLRDFPAFEKRYALNEMGLVGGKAVRMDMPNVSPAYAELDAFLQTGEFLNTIEQLTGIEDLLYDPDYMGGGTHENVHGQGLDAHVDFNVLPKNGWHRRLNLILYLNPEWQPEWGGCLTLESDPWDVEHANKVEIVPKQNRCAVFETSEVSWHGFAAIDLPEAQRGITRKSIAIYLYTRTRPAQQTAPSHGTVYVPRGLPSDLAVGMPLSDRQFLDLRNRFAQLKGQLKYLYRRELEFSAQLSDANLALRQARAASAVPLQGFVVLGAQTEGYFPDGWCEATFSFAFSATRAGKSLSIACWVPDAIALQTLRISIGSYRGTLEIPGGRSCKIEIPMQLKPQQAAEVVISADCCWMPASTGSSSDARALAFKMLTAVFE
jgi:Rps23 Pro-64 3,4-dihydroxylase Tpa1-like proline 4-hydroxylase